MKAKKSKGKGKLKAKPIRKVQTLRAALNK